MGISLSLSMGISWYNIQILLDINLWKIHCRIKIADLNQAIQGELGGLEDQTLIFQFVDSPQRIQAQINSERMRGRDGIDKFDQNLGVLGDE